MRSLDPPRSADKMAVRTLNRWQQERVRKAEAEAAAIAAAAAAAVKAAAAKVAAEKAAATKAAADWLTPASPEGVPAGAVDVASASAAAAQSAPPPPPKTPEQLEQELRTKLHSVFDEFDDDQSGTISRIEFENVIAAANYDCRLNISPSEIDRMMQEADADGSGEVSFDEFVECIKKELEAAKHRSTKGGSDSDDTGLGTGLLAAVSQTKAFWNPLGWLTSSKQHGEDEAQSEGALQEHEEPEELEEPDTQMASTQQVVTARLHTYREENVSVRSQRSVLSEWMIKQQNAEIAEEKRIADRKLREFHQSQQKKFLERQRRRIRDYHQQEADCIASIEAFNETKREVGKAMRLELKGRYEQVRADKKAHSAAISEKTLEVRRLKKEETEKRHEEQRKHGVMVALQAAEERRERREDNLKTVRAQQKATQDFAAQVKFQTRPAVRKLTRDFFQGQRNAIVANEKRKQEEDRQRRGELNAEFMEKQHHMIRDVRSVSELGVRKAKSKFEDKRRQEADEVRKRLQLEQDRSRQSAEDLDKVKREKHEAIMQERFDPRQNLVDELRTEFPRESFGLNVHSGLEPWAYTA